LRIPSAGAPSLQGSLAAVAGLDWRVLQRDRGGPVHVAPEAHRWLPGVRTAGDAIDGIETASVTLVREVVEGQHAHLDAIDALGAGPDVAAAHEALAFARERLLPALRRTTDELDHLVDALAGHAVPAG